MNPATPLRAVHHAAAGPALALIFNAFVWGVSWWPFRQLESAGLHPLWSIPSSLLFGGMLVGANALQRALQVPSALVIALNGLIVVFVVSSEFFRRRSRPQPSEESLRLASSTQTGWEAVADPPVGLNRFSGTNEREMNTHE